MIEYGTASETARSSGINDGLTSQIYLKIQSAPYGNIGDKRSFTTKRGPRWRMIGIKYRKKVLIIKL